MGRNDGVCASYQRRERHRLSEGRGLKGVAKEVSVEDTLILVGETEDYFGTDDEQAEEAEEVDDEYDDYETLPEIPAVTCSAEEVFTDIYSDEEY